MLELKLMAEGGLKLINDEYIILACLLLCNRCRRINAALEKYKLQTNIVTKKCIVSIWAQLIWFRYDLRNFWIPIEPFTINNDHY